MSELLRSVRLVDVADVLVVAAFFFVAITWLRRSQSGSAARRIAALAFLYAGVYLLADLFDLFLVGRLLEVLFFFFLLAAAVAFQADIRRLLDRVATWGFARGPGTASASSPVEMIVEAAAHLAARRTGALIAIRGSEPWESHLQGGVELDGALSHPLLCGIFHPDNPGHDGAVLVERDRVTRFAAHLPLATRLPEASRFGGTRHAAALGLAEECDALVVVVSEERGTISVAEQGTIREVESAAELGAELERFWSRHHAGPATVAGAGRRRRTLESAGLALGLSLAVWLLLAYSADTVYRTFEVPIEFRNLPPEWVLENDSLPTALATVVGSERAFGRLEPADLAVSFDLSAPRQGVNRLAITDEKLGLPSGLHLHDVNPRELSVVAERQRPVELPVEIRTTRRLADSLLLEPEPRTVKVFVAGEGAARPDRIPTEPVDPRRLPRTGGRRVELVLPSEVRLAPEQRGEVTVSVRRRGRGSGG